MTDTAENDAPAAEFGRCGLCPMTAKHWHWGDPLSRRHNRVIPPGKTADDQGSDL